MPLIFIVFFCLLSACSVVRADDGFARDSLAHQQVSLHFRKAHKAFYTRQWDEALQALDSMYAHALTYKDKEETFIAIAKCLKYRGNIQQEQGKFAAAYQTYMDGIRRTNASNYPFKERTLPGFYKGLLFLFKKQNQPDSIEVYIQKIFELPDDHIVHVGVKHAVALVMAQEQKYAAAIQYSNLCLNATRALQHPELAHSIYSLMAGIYDELGDNESFIIYTDSALQIAQTFNDSAMLIKSYDALGLGNMRLKAYPTALKWFQKGVALSEILYKDGPYYKKAASSKSTSINMPNPLGTIYQHLGDAYAKLEQLDSTKLYYQKALEINYAKRNYDHLVFQLGNWAELCVELGGTYEQGIDSLRKAYKLLEQVNYAQARKFHIFKQFGRTYMGLNQLDSAQHYYERALVLAKAMDHPENLSMIYGNLEQFYQTKKAYQKAYEYQQLRIAADEIVRKQANQKRLASLEVKYELRDLKANNAVLKSNNQLQQKELVFSQQLNRRNQILIAALMFGIVLLFVLGMVLYRQKSLNEQVKVMKLEQKALKAQINPHFFFNVLNSLQGTILSESPMDVYRYHSKFTQLMRLVLMQSEEESIPLEEELKTLKLYIELEQLRTGNAFEFSIETDLKEQQTVLVPSMLLQPFVENAIWHGVMNRPEGAERRIDIRVQEVGATIVCEIEDTGVGRVAAAKIKAQKTNPYKSMGIQVTQDRLELFRLRHKLPLTFKVEDILDAQQKVKGTKVSLDIPILV